VRYAGTINLNGYDLTISAPGFSNVGTPIGHIIGTGNVNVTNGDFNVGDSSFTGMITGDGINAGVSNIPNADLDVYGIAVGAGANLGDVRVHRFVPLDGSGVIHTGSLAISQELTYNGTYPTPTIDVHGTVDLANAYLWEPSIPIGPFTLIYNDGSDPVTGHLKSQRRGDDLPEGTTWTAGEHFKITYQGGDGNDVVIFNLGDGSTPYWLGTTSNRLTVASNWSLGAVPSSVTATFPPGAAGAVMNDGAGLTLGGMKVQGTYSFGGNTLVLGGGGIVAETCCTPLTVNLPLVAGAPMTVAANGQPIVLNGEIDTGTYAFTLDGTSRIDVNGAVTNEGTFIAKGSNVVMNSPSVGPNSQLMGTMELAGSMQRLDALAGSMLSGNGSSRVTSIQGHVSPGRGNGSSVGTLHTWDLNLGPQSTFDADLTPITSDRLSVMGQVTLGGGTLHLRPQATPPALGTSFTLIENDGTDSVNGTFAGLPEGTLFTAGTASYRITYHGGDGNDVAIVAAVDDPPPPPPSVVTLGIRDTVTVESDRSVEVPILLSARATSPVTVNMRTHDGSARAGLDYVADAEVVTIPAGALETSVRFTLLSDRRYESDEAFSVELSAPTGATLSRTEATVLIHDDDAAPRALRALEYASAGGVSLTLDLLTPATGSGPFPLIVSLNADDRWTALAGDAPADRELSRGYAVAHVLFRSPAQARFPAQIADVKAAIRWLRANAQMLSIDPNRIAVWGVATGGHLAALVGTSADVPALDDLTLGNAAMSSRVSAVVDFYGQTNLASLASLNGGCMGHDGADSAETLLLGCRVSACPTIAAQASPTSYATKDDAALLALHGEEDCTILPTQSEELVTALATNGVAATTEKLTGVGHGGVAFEQEATGARIDAFLDGRIGKVKGRAAAH
jgi:dienelactone hydrolase